MLGGGSDGKGGAAAAGGRGVRVANHEARPFQVFFVIDFRIDQVLHAHWIDEQGDARILKFGIPFLSVFIECEAILEAGTAATADKDSQHQRGIVFLRDQVAHFQRRRVGKSQGGARCKI